ncbi:MAG: hypothetical protein EKK53_21655 [Burkholderiales bacterium]|nr:MAG: hypothetical protein EKK53_21655 [Burkholderiales bacterium]
MRDGTPWFVASDLAKLLGHRDATSMTRSMDDEDRGTHIVCTPSAAQQMTIVNESGLYCAIFASRRPEAKQFKRWVTAEVLPAIRGTGTYAAPLAVSHTAPLPYQPKPEPRPRAINQAEYNALAAIAEKASMCYSLPGVGRHAAWRVAREAAGISKGGIRSMPAASLAAVKARMEEFLAESKKLRDALLVAERALASRFPGVRPAASDEVVWTPERVEAWLSADRAAR